nr:MAG TPA: hypothetical protein [Caudoviricetes sp.]
MAFAVTVWESSSGLGIRFSSPESGEGSDGSTGVHSAEM